MALGTTFSILENKKEIKELSINNENCMQVCSVKMTCDYKLLSIS